MCAVKQLSFRVFFVFQILSLSIGKPLFLNHTFITSLLGTSSGSNNGFENNPYSENVAIVPPKPEKLEQSYQENTNNNVDNSFVFPTETNSPTDLDYTTTSETPNILSKKFEKIIRKILTVAQIKQAVRGHLRDENSGFQYPYSPDLDAQDIRISKEYGQPLKIDLTTNERRDKIEEKQETEEKKEEKISPSTVGIFIFELFASLIGLTLGAAAQINHALTQNNTV